MGRGPKVLHCGVPFALARQLIQRSCGVGEPRDIIAKEITGAQVGKNLLDRGWAGEVLYGLDQFGTGERLALSQLITQKLATGLAPTAFGDADL
jgi:hypothetical protein